MANQARFQLHKDNTSTESNPCQVYNHGLVKVFSDDTAKTMLEQFLANSHKGTKIVRLLSVQKWEYTEEPFWAIVVELFGIYLTGIYGFHVHVDGEVVMVGKQPRELRKHEDTGC